MEVACVLGDTQIECLLSTCEVVAKIKTSLLWYNITSTSWGQG